MGALGRPPTRARRVESNASTVENFTRTNREIFVHPLRGRGNRTFGTRKIKQPCGLGEVSHI